MKSGTAGKNGLIRWGPNEPEARFPRDILMTGYERLLAFTCFAAGASVLTAGLPGNPVLKIECAPSPDGGGNSGDRDVTVRVIVRNKSHRAITIPTEGLSFDYTVRLVDARGHTAPRRLSGPAADSAQSVSVNVQSGVLIARKAGTGFEDKLPLSECFDLSVPGVYSLQVSRRFEPRRETVKSNLLRIAIK